jgi:hypothetical protein
MDFARVGGMKAKDHDTPIWFLSYAASMTSAAITRTCFPVGPMRGLSNMALAMLMTRLNIDATVHGMRASAMS